MNLFILFFISCTFDKVNLNPQINYTNTYSLVEYESMSYKLDSLTSDISISSQYIEDKELFSFLSNKNEILFYNNQGILQNRIRLLNKGISTYLIAGDTIFLFDYLNNNIIVQNTFLNEWKEIPIKKEIPYYPAPPHGASQLIYQNNNLFFFGNISGEYDNENKSNRMICGKVNLKNNNINYYLSYPSLYFEYNWGGELYRWIYSTHNIVDDILIFSFPAEHYIYKTNLKFETYERYYAGSQKIDKIPPLKKKKKYNNSEISTKYFVENHSYSTIKYDKYNNVFYRIAEMKTKYKGLPKWNKEISVIILDNELKKIGESYIGKCHPCNNFTMYVNENGLHIQKESTDEDSMLFTIYKLIKNEN